MKVIVSTAACSIILAIAVPVSATPVLDHPLPGGYFNAEYFAGSGANTAYFVIDFGGSGGSVHGFGYRWDGTQTADNALLAIDAAGAFDMTYNNFGTPSQPNLFLDRLTDPPDTDQPDFSVDGRFWDYFLGSYSGSGVGWTESNYGISGRDFVTGNVVQMLSNGGFYGLYASANNLPPPHLPVSAVPEPSAVMLIWVGGVAVAGAWRRRRKKRPRSACL